MKKFWKEVTEPFNRIIVLSFLFGLGLILWGDYNDVGVSAIFGSGLAWFIKSAIQQQFEKSNQKRQQQHDLYIQELESRNSYKQHVAINMYEVTNELWKQASWILSHWKILWPGGDKPEEELKAFNLRHDEFGQFILEASINTTKEVTMYANALSSNIAMYKWNIGAYSSGQDVNIGEIVNDIKESRDNLSNTIREQFKQEKLPSDILNVTVKNGESPIPNKESK